MAKKDRKNRLKARPPRGFADRDAADIRASETMMAASREVYQIRSFLAEQESDEKSAG